MVQGIVFTFFAISNNIMLSCGHERGMAMTGNAVFNFDGYSLIKGFNLPNSVFLSYQYSNR